jgi:flavin-dependent dehydrogenase
VVDTDLVIVGGGPAGLATAIEARLAGLEVVLVDRRQPPVDMACGEGLMPGGVERLRRLGATIPEHEGRIFNGIRYTDGDVTAEARFSFSAGIGIRRTVLQQALVRRAETLGADLRWGVTVTGLGDRSVESDAGTIRGDLVVAADGRLSRLRSWAGIATRETGPRRFGLRRHYRIAPWADLVEVHWSDVGEAYVTPVGPETIGVAVLSGERPLDFDRLLRHFPRLAARLDGVDAVSRDRGAGPFGQRPASVLRGRLALVGDASGCLDPITGEGLSVAFGQAVALVRALRSGDLESYESEHRRIVRMPRTVTTLLLAAERRPGVRRLVVRSFAASPRLFSRVVDLVAGAGLKTEPGRTTATRARVA